MANSAGKDLNVKLHGVGELEEAIFSESQDLLVMASLRAPLFEQNPEDKRAPVDICCVIDRSGSMAGEKLQMVKQAMLFVLKNLNAEDSLSVVTYDTQVQTLFEFTLMDKAGRDMAQEAINNLNSGDMTNLSGGLLQGLELTLTRKNPHDICSVLLFTDGLANHGITESAKITAAMTAKQEQVQPGQKPSTVFTFGFGSDHDEKMLRAIAEAGSGMYYFVSDVDLIPTSFADCLGGLQSVVAQNLTVTLEGAAGEEGKDLVITKSLNKKFKMAPNQQLPGVGPITLELTDLYSEEERDLVFMVTLPALSQERPDEHDLVNLTLKYFNVLSTQECVERASIKIRRPGTLTGQNRTNLALDQQRNRLKVAEAIEEAKGKADRGEFNEAREVISKVKGFVQNSPSHEENYCQKLVRDLDECTSDLANKEYYRNEGGKKMSRKGHAHYYQRSNRIVDTEEDFYETSSKMNYKMKSRQNDDD